MQIESFRDEGYRSHRNVPSNCHGGPPNSPEKQNFSAESDTRVHGLLRAGLKDFLIFRISFRF